MGGGTKGCSGYGWREHISGVNGGENQGMQRVRVARELPGVNRGDVKKSISYRPQVPAFDTTDRKSWIVKTVRKKVDRKNDS